MIMFIIISSIAITFPLFSPKTEADVEFIRKLEDVDVTEIPGTAVFECEVSRLHTTAQWFCNNQPITASDKFETESKGVIHRLTIKEVDGKDEGDYKVVVKSKSSEAGLFVEGDLLSGYLVVCDCVCWRGGGLDSAPFSLA
jgi:hypothetical protein